MATKLAIDAGLTASLLAELHKCVCEEQAWPAFLQALRRAIGADHANIAFRRSDAPLNDVTAYVDNIEPVTVEPRYFSEFYQKDPLPYHALAPGRLYALPELLDPEEPANARYMREFLHPQGIHFMRIVRVTEPGGYTAWLTVARQRSDFAGREEALMHMVVQHFGIALRAYAQLDVHRQRQAAYEAAVSRLNIGVVTLDADGRILAADPTAIRMIEENSALDQGAQGELLICPPGPRRVLRQALRDFARSPNGSSRALHLSDAPRCDMLLLPVSDRPLSGAHTPVLNAYLHSDREPASRLNALMQMFQLSRNEARLALAISRGIPLAEAASDIGITVASARTYSKRIFQKTGTHRQAELAHLILTRNLSLT